MELHERIKMLLERCGMTQRDLAQKTGLTEAAVCRYVRGERVPRSPAMAVMARALGVSMDFLATGEEGKGVAEVKNVLMRNAGNLSKDEIIEVIKLLMQVNSDKKNKEAINEKV